MSVAWPSDLPPPAFPASEASDADLAVYDFRNREQRRRVNRSRSVIRCTFLLRPQEWSRWLTFWDTDTAEGVLPVNLPASWFGRAIRARMRPEHRVTMRGILRRVEVTFEEV